MKLKNLLKKTRISTLFIYFLLSSSSLFAQEENLQFSNNLSSVYGTFQFAYPNETKLFWSIDFMESLYGEIEHRRQEEVEAYWYYSPDVTIIIYSREFINAEGFESGISPFDGVKEPK